MPGRFFAEAVVRGATRTTTPNEKAYGPAVLDRRDIPKMAGGMLSSIVAVVQSAPQETLLGMKEETCMLRQVIDS